MKRYLITKRLKNHIKNHPYTIREMNNLLGFEIRNILNKNLTIRKDHLQKISSLLQSNFRLKEIYIDYGKNLGENIFTEFIKKIKKSKKVAEFIGIMLGDGNIWKNRIRIAFDKRNTQYINHVSNLFEEIFGIKPKKEILEKTNQAYIYCTNLFVVEELSKLGLMRGSKIKNNLGIPQWIKENKGYSKRCIKGLIDTDGCIYRCKREKQTYIKSTNFNKRLLDDFKKLTKDLGYFFAKANNRNVCLYGRNEVVKFIKDIQPFKSNGAMG